MRRRRFAVELAWLAVGLGASAATAQGVGDLALAWSRGDFRAPLICEIDGVAHRVLRRVEMAALGRVSHRTTNRLVFHDLEAPGRTPCYDELGEAERNVIGVLTLVHPGRRDRPDTAQHDFQEQLRREGGIAFQVARGRLRIGSPGAPQSELRSVDFQGGEVRVSPVRRGSDTYRRLADFGPRRKLRLEIRAPDGEALGFDLVQIGPD